MIAPSIKLSIDALQEYGKQSLMKTPVLSVGKGQLTTI